MRKYLSYGLALIIVLVLAGWLATGVLVTGGKGPGNGEKPVTALLEKSSDAPATQTAASTTPTTTNKDGIDPAQTIAQRNDAGGNGTTAAPRSVRITEIVAQAMPIEVPLRGRTKAKTVVSAVPETSGAVQSVSVQKGQKVAAGDLLCTLDPGTRQAAVAQAQAAVDQAQTAFDANEALRKKGLANANSGGPLESALKAAQAGLDNAKAELGRVEVRAKIAGVIQDPLASEGTMLSPSVPCATIVQLDPMLFIASVPEAKIGYAKLGLPATITAATGGKAEGKVTYIAATADDATRSFPIEIEVPNPSGSLLDGISADATVNVGTAPALLLPQSSLTLDDNGVLGIRTVEGDKVAFHAVTIVKDTREGVWVVGLPPKINLITVGQEFVQAGQVVDAKIDNTPIGTFNKTPAVEGAQS